MSFAGPSMSRQEPGMPLRVRLAHPGARRWYRGSIFGLVYQAIEVAAVATGSASVGAKVVAIASLSIFYAGFVLLPPLVWPLSDRVHVLATIGYTAASAILFLPVGETTVWVWTLGLVMAAFTWNSQAAGYVFVGVVTTATIGVAALAGFPDSISYAPYVTASVGTIMVAFGHQVRQTAQLRAANDQIAKLAVDEERARFARDLHDSLGHSLTVVAVKSELAGKLVERDPGAAIVEIASIERLAREALGDLRASVSGFRGVTLDGELAAAQTVLGASGIVTTVTGRASAVRPDLAGLFAWVVREGVTNVLRHADARVCEIEVTRTAVRVANDGAARPGSSVGGNGLRGLGERAAAVGARLDAGPVDGGGFQLRVHR